jgi:predicted ATPase
MNIPQQNLNSAFIGEVSTGKSTILNGIYCREITQSSIKRTMMCPSIFIENKDLKDTDIDEKKIYEEIKLKNQEIIKDILEEFYIKFKKK